MKISYRYESKDSKKKTPLSGVRKANQPVIKPKKPKRKLLWGRIIITSVILFALEGAILYLIKVPIVKNSIDYMVNPNSGTITTKYDTIKLQVSEEIPEDLRNSIKDSIKEISNNDVKRFEFVTEDPDITLEYKSNSGDNDLVVSKQYLVPVGHMYWIKDGVTTEGIKKNGILVAKEDESIVKKLIPKSWGDVKITVSEQIRSNLMKDETRIALVPLSKLDGQFKIEKIDGTLFYSNPDGGIKYSIVLSGDSNIGKAIINARASDSFPTSYDPEKLLSVRMTGVTAITRSLGMKTDASGDNAYASRKIGDFLSKADLTHVSNEISFLSNCSYTGGVSFCTKPEHIASLKDSGVDIVELTGNHNNDKGASANTNSINTYKKLGWEYFGGGLDEEDAAKILYKDLKGTKVAFIGYNYYDTVLGTGAIATSSHAGANSWSKKKVSEDVAEAKKNADVVIVTFQYQECWAYTSDYSTNPACYAPLPSPNQKSDFRYAIDAGADIVMGTQAHQPQTYEIYKGKVIFYGLGNLYFDQTYWLGTRQGMVLTHYMYDGQYLGTDITTTIYDNDMLTYITTGDKRTTLLKSLKDAR